VVSIQVLVVDDQAMVRAGISMLLATQADIEVVGQAADGARALDAVASTRPDVVLMDIRMPGVDGLEATRRIGQDDDLAGVRVLILTTYEADEYVYQALQNGASGFLVKDTEPAELVRAIRVVAAGDALLSPGITRRLIADVLSRPRPAPRGSPAVERHLGPDRPQALAALTGREREVLAQVAAGLSHDEIAAALYLSPLTVKTHVSRMMTKLGVRDRAQLVVLAYESGLVIPGATG
jgi:DNA-binding NarL/FixJ family response regulator